MANPFLDTKNEDGIMSQKIDMRSKYNPLLTVKYMATESENLWFDRKSCKSKPSGLADDISAFANAEGGTIVIGINNDREFEGINQLDDQQINDLIEAPGTTCKPMPRYKHEFIPFVHPNGKEDRLLLLHISANAHSLIRTTKDDTYLRIADRSVLMKGDNLRQLEYEKQLHKFEDEICPHAKIADLDTELIENYKRSIEAEHIQTEQLLQSRGMMRDGTLTYAAVLLFAKNIRQFYQNCRVRFIRYEGTFALSGTRLNIIKDHNIEAPIPRLIEQAKAFICTQLRDFTSLDSNTGKFETTPEYPEFAWQEGVINAITHREYALSGDCIRVIMYDDRLVIESPGKLPYPVTTKNIKTTRASRNPVIARSLTEMGWVRELNEGVKRIYSDMAEFYLHPPTYQEIKESGQLRLTLANNIMVRHARFKDKALKQIGIDAWEQLDDLERAIVIYMAHVLKVKASDLALNTGYSVNTIHRRLSNLIDKGIIICFGKRQAPRRFYCLAAYSEIAKP